MISTFRRRNQLVWNQESHKNYVLGVRLSFTHQSLNDDYGTINSSAIRNSMACNLKYSKRIIICSD